MSQQGVSTKKYYETYCPDIPDKEFVEYPGNYSKFRTHFKNN